MAGLACRSRSTLRKRSDLLHHHADTVFGREVHLVRIVIRSLMAGHTGLRLAGFDLRERVPGVAGIAGRGLLSESGFLQSGKLFSVLRSELVATAASLA